LLPSVLVFTHEVPQSVPLVHVHAPPVHVWPLGHTRPQLPQLELFVWRSTQLLLQSACGL
jgi:hypothetical protein